MSHPGAHHPHDLLGGPPPTLLPVDPAAAELAAGVPASEVAAAYPASSLAWAVLAEEALANHQPVIAYACGRTGYHRGLDALRRNGWKGFGPVPYDHEPNQGWLRCVAALAAAAGEFNEQHEVERLRQLITDSDATAPV
jgi:hypothetical protein